MPRYILIDHDSGYIFGDTADYAASVASGDITPVLAARLLDESLGDHGRTYEEHGSGHRPNGSAYRVYRADVGGAEAVAIVNDGQDRKTIGLVERDCVDVAVVTWSDSH